MTTPISLTRLKKDAKQYKKENNIKLHAALEHIARQHGFDNFQRAQETLSGPLTRLFDKNILTDKQFWDAQASAKHLFFNKSYTDTSDSSDCLPDFSIRQKQAFDNYFQLLALQLLTDQYYAQIMACSRKWLLTIDLNIPFITLAHMIVDKGKDYYLEILNGDEATRDRAFKALLTFYREHSFFDRTLLLGVESYGGRESYSASVSHDRQLTTRYHQTANSKYAIKEDNAFAQQIKVEFNAQGETTTTDFDIYAYISCDVLYKPDFYYADGPVIGRCDMATIRSDNGYMSSEAVSFKDLLDIATEELFSQLGRTDTHIYKAVISYYMGEISTVCFHYTPGAEAALIPANRKQALPVFKLSHVELTYTENDDNAFYEKQKRKFNAKSFSPERVTPMLTKNVIRYAIKMIFEYIEHQRAIDNYPLQVTFTKELFIDPRYCALFQHSRNPLLDYMVHHDEHELPFKIASDDIDELMEILLESGVILDDNL